MGEKRLNYHRGEDKLQGVQGRISSNENLLSNIEEKQENNQKKMKMTVSE